MSLAVATLGTVSAQESFEPLAGEYSLSGPLVGDQIEAAVALSTAGGIVVWEDNFTDGEGSGIRYRRLDGTFSGIFSSHRVNETAEGNQGKPDVAMLSDGGSVIVWEGGAPGFEDVYARFLGPDGTWTTGEVRVNTVTLEPQEDPAVAALDNNEAVVVWSSFNQVSATSMKDVFFQRLSSDGDTVGSPVRVNLVTSLNQRSPDVCRLSDGRFVVVWVNETRRFVNGTTEVYDVDVHARIFSAAGVALTGVFKVNTAASLCANPSVAAASDGGFLVAWSQKNPTNRNDGWDIACRAFSAEASGGTQSLLNDHRYGDQFRPSVAFVGSDALVVWTSLAQDGSHEGVFGRFVGADGVSTSGSFQVNTTSVNKQLLPALASDGGTRFLAVWSGFTGVSGGFDVFAQRYVMASEPLVAPDPPYVWALSDSELKVSWPELGGFPVGSYQVHVNGATTAAVATTNNWWNATNLSANTTYTFRLKYVLTDGRASPLSGPASGTTYGASGFLTYFWDDVVPADWLAAHWPGGWPSVHEDSDGDGATNKAEFLAGTDPLDPDSVLRTRLASTPQGLFLHWNTEPGKLYQVQHSTDFTTWTTQGGPRFAPGDEDSLHVGDDGSGAFRVVLLRN